MKNNDQILKQLITIQENSLACLQGVHAIINTHHLSDKHLSVLEIIKDELKTINAQLVKIGNQI